MRTTQQMGITLPLEMARIVTGKGSPAAAMRRKAR